MSAHTKGKLGVDAHSNIVSSDGKLVAFPCISAGYDQRANASRLAACWNACDGISTESIVNGTALITAFQREQDRADTAERQADELSAMNAELLDALKGVVRVADRATSEFDAARAAIAKATGQKGGA